jgi:hypothetical protein
MLPLFKSFLDKGLEINVRVAVSMFNEVDWVFRREELIQSGPGHSGQSRAPRRNDRRNVRAADTCGRRSRVSARRDQRCFAVPEDGTPHREGVHRDLTRHAPVRRRVPTTIDPRRYQVMR